MHISETKTNFHAPQTRAAHQANGEEKTRNHKKPTEQATASPKEDTVTISEEGYKMFNTEFNIRDLDPSKNLLNPQPAEPGKEYAKLIIGDAATWISYNNIKVEGTFENSIYNALEGKVENARDITAELGARTSLKGYGRTGVEGCEDARVLAEHLAATYFDDPDEAKAFMDLFNERIHFTEFIETEMSKPQEDLFTIRAINGMPWSTEASFNYFSEFEANYINEHGEEKYWDMVNNHNLEYNNLVNEYINAKKDADFRNWASANGYGDNLKMPQTVKEYAGSAYQKASEAYNDYRKAEHAANQKALIDKYNAAMEHYKEQLNAVQALVDKAQTQARATPIEELLAKYNISVKAA